jgi:hypothetical protein
MLTSSSIISVNISSISTRPTTCGVRLQSRTVSSDLHVYTWSKTRATVTNTQLVVPSIHILHLNESITQLSLLHSRILYKSQHKTVRHILKYHIL